MLFYQEKMKASQEKCIAKERKEEEEEERIGRKKNLKNLTKICTEYDHTSYIYMYAHTRQLLNITQPLNPD